MPLDLGHWEENEHFDSGRIRVDCRQQKKQSKVINNEADRVAAALLVANDVAESVVYTSRLINTKLDLIHILVNSNLTNALQAEMDATTRELMMMQEVVSLQEVAGSVPLKQIFMDMTLAQQRIDELALILVERLKEGARLTREETA